MTNESEFLGAIESHIQTPAALRITHVIPLEPICLSQKHKPVSVKKLRWTHRFVFQNNVATFLITPSLVTMEILV